MTRALLAVARALLEIAKALRDLAHRETITVGAEGITVHQDGMAWFHRHEWTAEQWKAIVLPTATIGRTVAVSKPGKRRVSRRKRRG